MGPEIVMGQLLKIKCALVRLAFVTGWKICTPIAAIWSTLNTVKSNQMAATWHAANWYQVGLRNWIIVELESF